MKVRDAIVGGPGPHDLFVEIDYGQLEMYVMAIVSQCPDLADTLRRGVDIHRRTAAAANKCTQDQVTSEQRRAAKPVNFSLAYGATANGISKKNSMPVAQAQKYVDGYYAAFPGVGVYHKALLAQAKAGGRPATYRDPGGLPLKKFELRTPYGKLYTFIQETSAAYPTPNFSPTKLKNWPIQGLASDIIRLAMARVWRDRLQLFKATGAGTVRPAGQVHDSVNLRLERTHGPPTSGVLWPDEIHRLRTIRKIMIAYPQQWLVSRGLAWPHDLPLKADIEVGRTWGQLKKLDLETNAYVDE